MHRKTPFTPRIVTALAVGAVLFAGSAPAFAERDALIDGARLCTQQFPLEEKKNNIPTHLLAAIATTESGRWHDGLGMSVPWPWTINVEGKGYYFNSKAEAIAQTRNFLAQGRQSIDVGCMQVNLKHHPKAFSDLNQAFDPATNVAYSAKFLSDNYATLGDWIKATAAYHSRTPVYGQRYLADIERSWNKIVGKVASARAGSGGDKTTQTASVAAAKPQPRVTTASRPMTTASRSRIIQVRDEPAHRDSEVMVVRAAPAAPLAKPSVDLAEAETRPVPTMAVAAPVPVTIPASNSVRRVSLDNTATAGVSQPGSSQFIFPN